MENASRSVELPDVKGTYIMFPIMGVDDEAEKVLRLHTLISETTHLPNTVATNTEYWCRLSRERRVDIFVESMDEWGDPIIVLAADSKDLIRNRKTGGYNLEVPIVRLPVPHIEIIDDLQPSMLFANYKMFETSQQSILSACLDLQLPVKEILRRYELIQALGKDPVEIYQFVDFYLTGRLMETPV